MAQNDKRPGNDSLGMVRDPENEVVVFLLGYGQKPTGTVYVYPCEYSSALSKISHRYLIKSLSKNYEFPNS